MEMDTNISDVLREVITFLECLRDVQLPLTLESLREKLLARSKETLNTTTMARSSSPYLDMNSGPKSLLLKKSEGDSEEYVGMEESPKKQNHQDYYETFENESQSVDQNDCSEQNDDETDEGKSLIRIYKNLSAVQIKSKCHKCGPLYKREGRKLFLSESRTCWIALIGSHLLIYRTERHNKPYAIYPIRGYMARPAPNLIPRDRQKSESAFEMYRPGNETLCFIARTPKDMDQWISKVCEVGCAKSKKGKTEAHKKKQTLMTEETPIPLDEVAIRHRDAGESIVVDKITAKGESASNKDEEVEHRNKVENPPPLPARIPRRLPSLPPDDDAIPSYKAVVEDDDDEDDIYHKIEDLRNETRYQNVLSRKKRADKKQKGVTYDDARAAEESNNKGEVREENGEMRKKQVRRSRDTIPSEEMYDDIVALSRINAINANSERQNHDCSIDNGTKNKEQSEELYDDIENLISHGKFAKDRTKDQTEISSKSPQKKSLLNRVLSRKESSGKKYKSKASSNPPSPSTKEEISTYDNASDLTPNRESPNEGNELPEYNCPPPPRPVYYMKSTTPNGLEQGEELYDDVSTCREQYKNQQTSLRSTEESGVKTKETMSNANTRLKANDDSPQEEIEHYQSPRSDLCIRDIAETQQNEDLYDDIALWEDFTARQRDISGKKDANEDVTKSTINSDKRSWNRFNRKSRTSDFETNRRSGANESEEIEDPSEGNGATKRNTFQKLISRMENSLAKVSARGIPSSLPTGKSSTVNNNL